MIRLAVIGDPIEHSLSPMVHGACLKELGIDYEYEKVRVKKGELLEFIDYAKKNGIDGFNLTMPHKTDIIEYLDEIDAEAELLGSVNTVKIVKNRLIGYNTDGDGYFMSISKSGGFKGKKIVILGAGGVVRTIALKGVKEGATEVAILNRTKKNAQAVADFVCAKTGEKILVGEMSEVFDGVKECDLLINATPLGMSGTKSDFDDLSFVENLPPKTIVSDLIYNPPKTSLLKKAEEMGHIVANGLGMLIYQGFLADKIYLGMDFDLDLMYEKTEKKIKSLLA